MKIFKSEKGKRQVLDSYDNLVASWGVNYEEKCIETSFGSTHVFLVGSRDNPPLLMFHGVGDNSAVMWLLNIRDLSGHFYCIAVDTLGGPGKSIPNSHYNKKEFNQVSWIDELAEKLDIGRFYIVGVSHGAYLAYLYTTKQKEKVIRAVCIEGGMLTNPWKSIVGTLLLAFPEILVPTGKNIIKIMKKMKPNSDMFDKHPEIVDHMLLVMKNHRQAAMFPHPLEKYQRELGQVVRDKLFFLFGGNLMGGRNEYINIMNDGRFDYKIIEGVGHGLNMEKPELVNQEIVDFLKASGSVAG